MKPPPILLLLLLATPAGATTEPYGWTISASSTDPWVNTGTATGGLDTLYLWAACCDVPDNPNGTPRLQGILIAEFSLPSSGIEILDVHAANLDFPGFFYVTPPDFLIAYQHCTPCPTLVLRLPVVNAPGSICFGPSTAKGRIGSADCEILPTLWGMDWIGFDNTGQGAPCSSGPVCTKPVPVDGSSWGRLKALYSH